MATISELIKAEITPADHDHYKEKMTVVSSRLICPEKAKSKVEGYRMDLFRISGQTFEDYTSAKTGSLVATFEQMSDEDKTKVRCRANALGTLLQA